MVELPKEIRDIATQVNRKLLLTLRKLLDEIENDSSMSALEVMWQVRSHTCNQAEIPQAIFEVGDRLASVIYLEDLSCWEVQLDGDVDQFDTFEQAVQSIGLIRVEEVNKTGLEKWLGGHGRDGS